MARAPFASWRPLNESEPTITPRTVIYHTMVGTLPSTDRFFREGTSLESHFGVGGPWEGEQFDGAIWQWVDTSRQADANLDANAYAISIETSDGGDPNRPWTPKQIDSLVRLGRWAAETHNIPKRKSPSCSDPAGFGWHVMHGAPSCWTPVAKSCPGAVRINQLKTVVFPRIFAATDPGAQDMLDQSDKQWFIDTLRQGFAGDTSRPVREWAVQLEQIKARLDTLAPALLDDEAVVLAAVQAVTSRVGSSEQTVLAALSALDLSLTPDQIAAIASAVNIDESEVAEAVRFRLSEALSA